MKTGRSSVLVRNPVDQSPEPFVVPGWKTWRIFPGFPPPSGLPSSSTMRYDDRSTVIVSFTPGGTTLAGFAAISMYS